MDMQHAHGCDATSTQSMVMLAGCMLQFKAAPYNACPLSVALQGGRGLRYFRIMLSCCRVSRLQIKNPCLASMVPC